MATTLQNKKRFPLVPVLIFLLLFSGIVFYGYTHFFKKEVTAVPVTNGLNSKLPAAAETKELNKLEMYLQAEKDSAMKKEQRSNDPYHKAVIEQNTDKADKRLLTQYKPSGGMHFDVAPKAQPTERTEKDIDQKIQLLYQTLNTTDRKNSTDKVVLDNEKQQTNNTPPLGGKGGDSKGGEGKGGDPELKQLEGMLDKLIDIQHPELVKERYGKKDSSVVASVGKALIKHSVTAVVHNTQVVSNGSTIKIRLTEAMVIGDKTIPKGNFLFGTCTLNNERLTVQLTNLTSQNEVIPVVLSVYDLDGIEGIYIPGNLSREVVKEGTDQAISSFNLNSYDPSLTGQVASAGLQATKALLSKKVKLIRVTVKAGHHVLLQNKVGY